MSLISAVKHRSARAIRRALMCGIGGIFLAVGLGFLTSAAWILLEDAYSALSAALVLAALYGGMGLVVLGIVGVSRSRDAHDNRTAPLRNPATPPQPGAMPPLAEAFIIGLNAALAARGRGPSDR